MKTLAATILALSLTTPSLSYEKATLLGTLRMSCTPPQEDLIVDLWDTNGQPDDGMEKAVVKDREGVEWVILTYEAGADGDLIGASVRDGEDMIYYTADAFVVKFPDVCAIVRP